MTCPQLAHSTPIRSPARTCTPRHPPSWSRAAGCARSRYRRALGWRYSAHVHPSTQPSTVAEARALGERALAEARFEQALAHFTLALESQPENLELRLRVADSLLALG